MKVDPGFDVFLAYPGEVRIRIRQSRAKRLFATNLVLTLACYGIVIGALVWGDVEWSIGVGVGVGLVLILLLPLVVGKRLLRLWRDGRRDQVFIFDKRSGSVIHNDEQTAALDELEGLEIEDASGQWVTEGEDLVHLSLVYNNGRSTSVGYTTAVRQLREAAARIAEALDVDVWDSGRRDVDPSNSIWYRDLGTGKYDPDVLRRIAPSDIVQGNWVIIVVALLMALFLFS